jgi:hypothetical protein
VHAGVGADAQINVTFRDAISMLLVGGRNRTVNEEMHMNTNTLEVTRANSFGDVREPAVQNGGSTFVQKLVFLLVWVAVSVPLIWGVMKAWDEAKHIF